MCLTVTCVVFLLECNGSARLSPSPATGLIGLKENAYIGDFFETMGFLPITSERCVESRQLLFFSIIFFLSSMWRVVAMTKENGRVGRWENNRRK